MTTYWVQSQGDDVFAALEAVEQALEQGVTGTPPAAAPQQTSDPDTYLVESLAAARASWTVDQNAVVTSSRPTIGRAFNLAQRLVRRATWWYNLPQWQQISNFHGALVRIVDVLLDRQRLLGIRIGQLEAANSGAHIFALEQQVQALRDEQRELRRRVAELEQALEKSR